MLAACGARPRRPAATARADGPDAKTRKAMLAFAQCMREHGVDMPDPKFGEGGRTTMRAKLDGPQEKMRAARATRARSTRRRSSRPSSRRSEKAEFRKAALANAKCLREHGIDVPDPQFGENGRRRDADRQARPAPGRGEAAGGPEGVRGRCAGRPGGRSREARLLGAAVAARRCRAARARRRRRNAAAGAGREPRRRHRARRAPRPGRPRRRRRDARLRRPRDAGGGRRRAR